MTLVIKFFSVLNIFLLIGCSSKEQKDIRVQMYLDTANSLYKQHQFDSVEYYSNKVLEIQYKNDQAYYLKGLVKLDTDHNSQFSTYKLIYFT